MAEAEQELTGSTVDLQWMLPLKCCGVKYHISNIGVMVVQMVAMAAAHSWHGRAWRVGRAGEQATLAKDNWDRTSPGIVVHGQHSSVVFATLMS